MIGQVVGKPTASECLMGAKPPAGQPAHIHFQILLKRKEEIGQVFMGEGIDSLEGGAILQNPLLCQQFIDLGQHPAGCECQAVPKEIGLEVKTEALGLDFVKFL